MLLSAAFQYENITIKDWILDGGYMFNIGARDISFQVLAPDRLESIIASDVARLGVNIVQSVLEVEKGGVFKHFSVWKVVPLYYAAFFSAHAILRVFGRSFTYLDKPHAKKISEIISMYGGPGGGVDRGCWLIAYDNKQKYLAFKKYKESHKDLWRCFIDLLTEAEDGLLNNNKKNIVRATSARCLEVVNLIHGIKELLTCSGENPDGNWLSEFRNEANYRSLKSVWYPFVGSSDEFRLLMACMRRWRNTDFNADSGVVYSSIGEKFFYTVFKIIDLALALINDLVSDFDARSVKKINFMRLLKENA